MKIVEQSRATRSNIEKAGSATTPPQRQVAALRKRIVSVTGAPEYSGPSAVSRFLSSTSNSLAVHRPGHRSKPELDREIWSGVYAEQLSRGTAQDSDPVIVAQIGSVEDQVNFGAGPPEGIVGSHHDLAGSRFSDQMA